ncbi:P2Y purinoceptor 2-like [Conger conger]|uniref:P2Y purinoceptor 2-like n=1 Tax=Conger conger TaxID=82655 RepID=UPI002A5ADC45|nr:P2Y purinoceptor 2-like [Conger conger]
MSNSTVCPPQKLHPSLPWLMVVFYLGGFLLNGLSLFLFRSRAMKWNSGVVLQFNLAISDMLVTPAAPLIVLYSLWDDWPFGVFLCQLKVFLLSVHVYGGICFLTLISIHRCSTVARHRGTSQSRMANPQYVQRLCVAVWVGLLLQGLPFFGLLDTWVDGMDNTTKCLNFHQPNMRELFFAYNLAVLVVGVLLPFCIFGACYAWLGIFLSRVKAQGADMKGRAARVIAACMFIFTLCYVPLHVTRTVGVTVALFHPSQCAMLSRAEDWYYASFTVSAANCCLDPLLYCFSSRRFRQALGEMLPDVRKVRILRSLCRQSAEREECADKPNSTVDTGTSDRVH